MISLINRKNKNNLNLVMMKIVKTNPKIKFQFKKIYNYNLKSIIV
jgi:hypothetical protein